jgi:hypothetical protein
VALSAAVEPGGWRSRLTSTTWASRAAVLACGLVLVTHPISFGNLLIDLRPSVVIAVIMIVVTILHVPQLLSELARPVAAPATLFLAWEVLLLLGFAFSWSYFDFWASPGLEINAITYLLLPQALCLALGLAVARDQRLVGRILDVMLVSGCVAISVAIALYLTRPGFAVAADERIYQELADRYSGFLPRMNGYYNSMILGAVCYSTMGIGLFRLRRPALQALVMVICLVGSALTMQRASWGLTGVTGLLGILMLIRGLVRNSGPRGVLILFLVLGVATTTVIGGFNYALDQPWFAISIREADNRVRLLNESVAERSGQWEFALNQAKRAPMGVGTGLLGSKSRTSEGLSPFAVTDGNLFSILVEQGPVGLFLFVVTVGIAIARTLWARRFDVAAPALLILAGSMGTNLFDLYYISFVFWLLIGIGLGLPPRPGRPQPAAG